jgi:hypothetical protein
MPLLMHIRTNGRSSLAKGACNFAAAIGCEVDFGVLEAGLMGEV